ncbi:hypothetical protein J7L13_01685, partial [bacterium]|nr:hypothetical protein [bacterium]
MAKKIKVSTISKEDLVYSAIGAVRRKWGKIDQYAVTSAIFMWTVKKNIRNLLNVIWGLGIKAGYGFLYSDDVLLYIYN